MPTSKKLLKTTMASILALAASSAVTTANAVPDQPNFWEKCAGISKTGMNDCGSLDGKHACAGHAKK